MARNPGRYIEHDDGRRGAVLRIDQSILTPEQVKAGKVIVQWWTDKEGKDIRDDRKHIVSAIKLRIKGYLD